MRKLLNRLLIKFGLLLTKAPTLLSDHALKTSQLFAAELTERVKVGAATEPPDNELFRIFSADTNVHKWHHYFDIYTRYFERFRDHPITMLEIGVFRGGSLRMWKKYFHPDSTIVGIDVDESCQLAARLIRIFSPR
jgi:hypothetical protein